MAIFLSKTKDSSAPSGKPRVYFTCHPDDFALYFENVCVDVFKSHSCAIYYTEDMNEEISDPEKETDLKSMNLFIVPVTARLLTQPNRAMESDLPYARERHIPILPLVMEPDIDRFYNLSDKFGEMQYLTPYFQDPTAIPYEDKLKNFLDSVLISKKTAQRIKAAFDAYVFLSYRKKDRYYANKLLKLIHKNPAYYDIAVWYDEFLIPGESFRKNIKKMLKNSKLFALLVTPHVLEYVNGNQNFVMNPEYKNAKEGGMDILPVEMQETDKAILKDRFEGVPDCVSPEDEDIFQERLSRSLSRIAISENDNEPEHNFMIGLAYLSGIDVETDRERGLRLITSAAEGGLVDAMEKLYRMYSKGTGVRIDYDEAIKWARRIAKHYASVKGETSAKTLTALNELASAYCSHGDTEEAIRIFERIYNSERKRRGTKHKYTLGALNNLAYSYGCKGQTQKALEMHQRAYDICCKTAGENDRNALVSLNNIAMLYAEMPSKRDEALRLHGRICRARYKAFGLSDPDTILSLNNLAYVYEKTEKNDIAAKLYKKAYDLTCTVFGENSVNAMTVLNNLANAYSVCKKYDEEILLRKRAYRTSCKLFGCDGISTMVALRNLSFAYMDRGDYKKHVLILEKAHLLGSKSLGEKHQITLELLFMIYTGYVKLEDEKKSNEVREQYKKLFLESLKRGET